MVSYLPLVVISYALVSLIARRRGTPPTPPGAALSAVRSFMAGVVLANAIPHFVHGVSGDYFPAPMFHDLGRGVATNIANVPWGLFNFAAGYHLVRSYPNRRGLIAAGFTTMSVFLAVVFSRWHG